MPGRFHVFATYLFAHDCDRGPSFAKPTEGRRPRSQGRRALMHVAAQASHSATAFASSAFAVNNFTNSAAARPGGRWVG